MINHKQIKKKVIDEMWGKKPKTGDDYRSLSKQINTFLEHLEEEDSPLQWLPLKDFCEQQIVDLTITFLKRPKKEKNRFLYNDIKHSEIMCDYGSLMVDNSKQREGTEIIFKIEPKLREISNNKREIFDTLKNTNFSKYQVITKGEYINLLSNLDELNILILKLRI